MTSKTSIDLNLDDGECVLLGTEVRQGEMKKGSSPSPTGSSPPARSVLPMHCSGDRQSGDGAIVDPVRPVRHRRSGALCPPIRSGCSIGDDEHCWTDTGIFNIEGGCYAKAINLSLEAEPDIFQALRFGAVLENVVLHEETRLVDFRDSRITENTRGAYPIEYIANSRVPCVADHPSDVIFLTCDAFGVLPPVSRLTPAQAMYWFISGYTAKVAGTEVGVKEPTATFSPCFGGPFLVWHPHKYATLLSDRLTKHKSNVWLVNTGWTGGRSASAAA